MLMPLITNALQESANPHLTIDVLKDTSGLLGRLVIDSVVNNHSLGGVRIIPDVKPNELECLARNMTLKFGFWNIPMGGAKACVFIDRKMPDKERHQFLARFGRKLAPLLKCGIYIPASDMGSNRSDIERILTAAECPVARGRQNVSKTHIYTSWTMHTSAEVAATHIGMDISRSKIAIEGFGKIGSAAVQMFFEAGARVVAISTIDGAIYDDLGLDSHSSELFSLPVDIIAPCAGSFSIDSSNAKDLKCRIVCPGANSPMSIETESALSKKGILCIPDFIANSGGVFGGHIESFVRENRIRQVIRTDFRKKVEELIGCSQERNVTLGSVAREISEHRFRVMKQKAENSGFQNSWIKSLIRSLPKSVTDLLAPLYFKRVLDI